MRRSRSRRANSWKRTAWPRASIGSSGVSDPLEGLPEVLLDRVRQKRQDPRVRRLPGLAPFLSGLPVRVVELLDALEGEGLSAQGQADAQDRRHPVRGVVVEVGLAPLEDLEEELAGELLDAQRQAVEGVVAHLEDQARQVLLRRHVAGEQLVEGGGRQRAAAEQVDARAGGGDREPET